MVQTSLALLEGLARLLLKSGIRESGNRGIGESGNVETVRDIGIQFVL